MRAAIARLPVVVEDRTGYDRVREFGAGWIDADRDGCNTRMEVLLAEAVVPPAKTGRCTVSGGRWYSWYDDTWIDGRAASTSIRTAETAAAPDHRQRGGRRWTLAGERPGRALNPASGCVGTGPAGRRQTCDLPRALVPGVAAPAGRCPACAT
ncbi:hypothetical protein ACWKT3_16810 [Streptomyces violaceus]